MNIPPPPDVGRFSKQGVVPLGDVVPWLALVVGMLAIGVAVVAMGLVELR